MTNNIHNCVNTLKNEKRIKVAGYKGFWSVIDDQNGYVLLEHNTYGDETCYLVVKANEFIWKEFKLVTGERKQRLKKQVFYKAVCDGRKGDFPNNISFEKAYTSHIAEVTDTQGNTFKFALEYNRHDKCYRGTELNTGLSTYPCVKKTKQELIQELSKLNLTLALESPANITLAKLLKAHIESEDTQ